MWIVGTVLILLVGAGVLIFNRLVKARNLVDEAWSGVDVQLKRRHDLVPNLVESVKGYTEHEHTLFDQIAQQRTKAIDGNPQTDPEDENALTRQIKTLFAVAEAYPDLKANQNFLDLQKKLVEIEDALQYARRYYNG
ncbi:MAG TPA: LemA family protein, partial [Armatimonadota bacterium]|nr:LemA family protein [Armatimonadota bacterium]